MARKFVEIEKEILSDPKRRAEVEKEKKAIRAAVALAELRESQSKTQAEMASFLGVSQANISRIERTENLYLSTLAGYIGALGGHLEVNAVFDDQVIRLAALDQEHESPTAA